MDTASSEQRHYNMSQIRGKDTQPELLVRRYLFSRGLRYRKNDKRLPGHPDIVFPKYKAVVFVNGCFWHGHVGCKYFVLPKTNTDFWENKISRNVARDAQIHEKLKTLGWYIIIVWECELKKDKNNKLRQLFTEITRNKSYK